MKYLQTKDFNDIINYCKSRCKKIINEHNASNIKYYRGQYKGYIYGISISTYYINSKLTITDITFYKIIKNEKIRISNSYMENKDFSKGLIDSQYDLLNYISKA